MWVKNSDLVPSHVFFAYYRSTNPSASQGNTWLLFAWDSWHSSFSAHSCSCHSETRVKPDGTLLPQGISEGWRSRLSSLCSSLGHFTKDCRRAEVRKCPGCQQRERELLQGTKPHQKRERSHVFAFKSCYISSQSRNMDDQEAIIQGLLACRQNNKNTKGLANTVMGLPLLHPSTWFFLLLLGLRQLLSGSSEKCSQKVAVLRTHAEQKCLFPLILIFSHARALNWIIICITRDEKSC